MKKGIDDAIVDVLSRSLAWAIHVHLQYVAGMDTSYEGQNISPQGRLMNCRGDINHGYYLQTSTSLQFYPFLADKGDGSRFPSIRN